jgi:hypothetical protein
MDFRQDALLLKARIANQIQPSGRLSAWSRRAFNRYGNCGFDFNRSDDCLSWSGHMHSKYGNCVLKINRPDGHPPWSGRTKPYMDITCSRRATVRTRLSNRKDFQRKSQKLWSHRCPSGRPTSTVRTAPTYFTTVAHLNLSL